MTHHWIPLMFSEDSRIWTFSVTASSALVLAVIGLVLQLLERRKRGTGKKRDTP